MIGVLLFTAFCCYFILWVHYRCGLLTVEIEHVDAVTLELLEQQGIDCQPKASAIRIIQVRLALNWLFCLYKNDEFFINLMWLGNAISNSFA